MSSQRLGLVVFGAKGSGKSTLCSTLISSKDTDSIKEDKPESQKFEIIGKEGQFGNQEIFVIDTQNLGETEYNQTENLSQIVQYIKENEIIRGIINTIDINSEQRLFNLIDNICPTTHWFKHIAIVWTKCNSIMNDQIEKLKQERKEKFKKFIENHFGKELNNEVINAIPHYFVDSIEARKKNNSSYDELCQLLSWAKQLKSIKEDLTGIKIGETYIERKMEIKYGKIWCDTWKKRMGGCFMFGPRITHGTKYQEITKIYFERTFRQLPEGLKEYSEWKEIEKETESVIIDRW